MPALIAPSGSDRTVPLVHATSSLHNAARIDLTRRSLGKLGTLDLAAPVAATRLRLVQPSAPSSRLAFPAGARTRKLDSSNRLKFTGEDRLSVLLDWEDGAVEVTADGGWLVLRQPGRLAGVSSARFSNLAMVTGAGGEAERIVLKPAHLALAAVPTDRYLLVAPVPEAGALVLVDPAAALTSAPIAVHETLDTVDDDNVTDNGERS